MTEPLSWLKLGPRSRTPTTLRSLDSSERMAARDSQPSEHRRPGSSRMSSYLTRASPTSPGPGREPLFVDDDGTNLLVRDQDQVWYNPSLEQMAEALQVLLMTRGVLGPIPVEYNSYVLHLVEGFANARENIRKAENAYKEVKQSLEQNLEQFRLVADDWLERESQYRAEVKRLEVLLSKTSRDGLEAVTLARTNSVVDRSGHERSGFLSRLNQFRNDHINDLASPSVRLITGQTPRTEVQADQVGQRRDPEQVPIPKILDNDNDFLMSEKIRQKDAVTRAYGTALRESRAYWRSETLQPGMDDAHQDHGGFGNHVEATSNVPAEGSDNYHTNLKARSSTEIHVRDGPARNLAFHVKGAGRADNAATTKPSSRHIRNHPGFSFEPGDDDFSSLLDEPTEGQGLGPRYPEQVPSHLAYESLESLAIETRKRHADDATSLTTSSICGNQPGQPREDGSPGAYHSLGDLHTMGRSPSNKLVRTCHSSVSSRQTVMGISPSQSSHGPDSPIASSGAGQETPQRQQVEMDARIAATRAITNTRSVTKQKK
ncbi:hypothetical protein HD806DRAFT_549405 [Xylariaceae sp. AK1471]|nr:hypothetical protein HD806DRAFT_549405 [Xylariaceae sp. AK1471]